MNTVNKPFRKKDAMQLVTYRRMPAATPRPARLTPRPAPMTAFSSTATYALWATWWPSWQAKTINASIRR